MRNQRVVNLVAIVLVLLVCTRDAIAQCVAEMYATRHGKAPVKKGSVPLHNLCAGQWGVVAGLNERIAESHACQGCRHKHLRLRLAVVGVSDGPWKVLYRHLQGLEREHIADGVCSLIGWA